MIYVAYCSAAVRLMQPPELLELLKVCRRNNLRDGITGMLLYREGSFMQVLEGQPEAVKQTYQRVLADPRHRSIIKLTEAPLAERNFADWSMGFTNTETLSAEDRAAVHPFLETPFDVGDYRNNSKALKLLLSFRAIRN